MNIILKFFVFILVLFIYLHINFHLKTSDDFELFELTDLTKDKLEEICDLKQPLKFQFNIDNFYELTDENIKKKYNSFDINLRNKKNNDKKTEIYLPIKFSDGIDVLSHDKDMNYFSEKNNDFLNETSLVKTIKMNDAFFRPTMLMNYYYDIIMGSDDTTTFLKYNLDYRNFFLIIEGNIEIKLTPPKSFKYLNVQKDYDNFEFSSDLNPWNIQDNLKNDFNKIKFMDVNLNKGEIIFIPCYWWYSFKLNKNVKILHLKYRTFMNNLAILPDHIKNFFQKQNIKHDLNISKDL